MDEYLWRSAILLDEEPPVDLERIQTMFLELSYYDSFVMNIMESKESKTLKKARYDFYNEITLITITELNDLVSKHFNACEECGQDFVCYDNQKNLYCSDNCQWLKFNKKLKHI